MIGNKVRVEKTETITEEVGAEIGMTWEIGAGMTDITNAVEVEIRTGGLSPVNLGDIL